jgi:benzoyl-CoA reductase/2-hydroxyglutaryl-CoA dehydratase subunit BcrC/BadD/HgdB
MSESVSNVLDGYFPAAAEIIRVLENLPEVITGGGKPVVGYFCSYTPVEILSAAGLQPYRIVPEPGRAMIRADTYIDRNFCPYVRTCLGEALDGRYRFLNSLVMVNSCDAMRRMYDVWRYNIDGDSRYLLDLPRIDDEPAVAYYRYCLEGLKTDIEKRFGVVISGAKLAEAINGRNELRSLLKELYLVNYERGWPLPATLVSKIVRAGAVLPREKFTGLLKELMKELENSGKRDGAGESRVMVTGSVLENPQILELVEQYGARVVIDDLCTGTRQFWFQVEAGENPLDTLARYYLKRVTCPRMKDAEKRFDHVLKLAGDFAVEGVIFYTMKFCDPFLYDIPVLKGRLVEKGTPVLSLEGDYTPGTLGRVKTRIEAFIEMLRQRVPTN